MRQQCSLRGNGDSNSSKLTAKGFSSNLNFPFPGADKTKHTFKPGEAVQGFSKGILIIQAWQKQQGSVTDRTLQLHLAVTEAWGVILKEFKSPLRMFRELNIFAVIL